MCIIYKDKIKYISIDVGEDIEKSKNNSCLADFIKLINLGIPPPKKYYGNYFYWCDSNPMRLSAIYLGDNNTLNNVITSKINPNISKINKILFDKSCEIPRYKLKFNSNIKKVNKIENADAVVISKKSFQIYESFVSLHYKCFSDIHIFYSKTHKEFYLIDFFIDTKYYRIERNDIIDELIKLLNNKGYSNSLTSFYELLISENILPNDSELFYKGNTILIKSQQDYEYINNILNNYNSIILEDDLDNYLNNNKEYITDEQYHNIFHLINSKDIDNIKIGIKLLENFNLSTHDARLSMLLYDNSELLRSHKICNTIGFKNIDRQLNVYQYFQHNRLAAYLNIHSQSNDDVGKNTIREYVKNYITNKMKHQYTLYSDCLKQLNLNININIE